MKDTLAWLLNFPVTNGYAMVFLAGFGLFGSIMWIFRGPSDGHGKLVKIRERERLPEPRLKDHLLRAYLPIRRTAASLLTIILGISLAAGIRGMTGGTWVREYIYEHGAKATGIMLDYDGPIQFQAEDGRTYTVMNEFFSPSEYPKDTSFYTYEGDEVTVRYLPSHPQAYVIDTAAGAEEVD